LQLGPQAHFSPHAQLCGAGFGLATTMHPQSVFKSQTHLAQLQFSLVGSAVNMEAAIKGKQSTKA